MRKLNHETDKEREVSKHTLGQKDVEKDKIKETSSSYNILKKKEKPQVHSKK